MSDVQGDLSHYTLPTGDGYLGVRKIRASGSVEIDVSPLDVEAGDEVYVYHDVDRGCLLLNSGDGRGHLERQPVTMRPSGNIPTIYLSTPARRALGVAAGDDVRIYEIEDGLEVVPANDDPHAREASE